MTLTILFLFQANQVLELALHLEKTVIDLKMDALKMWNIALAGMACGNLLTLIKNAYGYPESKQSIKHGQYLETVEHEFAENEPDAELAKGLTSKEAAAAEVVPKKCISERASAEGQSIYKYMDPGCPYLTAEFAQCCTHICRKHLGVCIKCQLCDHCSFRSVDIQKHLKDVHMNEEDKWFKPVPEQEGDIVEINQATLEANIALVKEERADDDEDEGDDDLQ